MAESSNALDKDGSASHAAARLEDTWQAWRVRSGLRRGHRATVIPFGGFGSTSRIRVLARILLIPAHKASPPDNSSIRGWRSFSRAPVPGAVVTIRAGSSTLEVTADRGGVIDTLVDVDLPAGWNEIWLQVGDKSPVSSKIFVVADGATTGIVCDIDDTVMVTALPRPFLAAWNTFVRNEHARMPVPGMAVLLERIVRQFPGAPVIYLSTGAWNVHATHTRFLGRHLYPEGTLLLTDWGPTHDRWFRSGQEHKRENLEHLAAEFPAVSWVLLGDDGQHDEGLYAEFATRHPDNVRAIAIRELLAPEAILAGGRSHHDRTAGPQSIPWVSAPDGAGLAHQLTQLGIIDRPGAAE